VSSRVAVVRRARLRTFGDEKTGRGFHGKFVGLVGVLIHRGTFDKAPLASREAPNVKARNRVKEIREAQMLGKAELAKPFEQFREELLDSDGS
jgi:hypothetical protein